MQVSVRPVLFSLVLVMFFFAAPFSAGIEDEGEVLSEYHNGLRMMREGDFFGAAAVFMQLEGRFPDSKNVDLFVLQRSKCQYYLGEYSKALAGFGYYIDRFGNSVEVSYAYFFLGNCRYRLGRSTEAVESWLNAYRLSEDQRLDELVQKSLKAAYAHASTVALSPELFIDIPDDKLCAVVSDAAPYLTGGVNAQEAEDLLKQCGVTVAPRPEQPKRPRRFTGALTIPIMMPFSGELAGYGQDIFNGAVIAAEKYRNETGQLIELAPHDTRADPVEAARLASELAEDNSIPAAVGPLTSDAAALTSATLACRDLPIIVPAATQAGLARLSETTFQLSPNIELQGLRMAQYAIDSLRADSAVILTSSSADHLRMSRAFSKQFEQLGGEIIAVEYYRPRDRDFGPYLRDLKAMIWGLPPDSIFFTNEYGDTLDPDGIPVEIDCLYLPGEPRQLRQLLPQIRFYKIEGAYLGSDGWADDAVLKLGDDVTRNAVISSPFLSAGNTGDYVQFAAAFDSRYGKQPSRLAALGYDAMRLLINALEAVGNDRERLVKNLAGIREFAGAAGRVTWSEYRENMYMPLYRIVSGEARPLNQTTTVADEPPTE